MSNFTRREKIGILMAGIETPGDLTKQEQEWNREDLLLFLQEEHDKCGEEE